jgi:hypothetical protein
MMCGKAQRALGLALTIGLCAAGESAQAQPAPGAPSLDPFLPELLRPVIEAASAAELDPRRGPGNAIAALKSEREKHTRSPALTLALDFRIAATGLRQRFLAQKSTPEPVRWEQALSTFGKLDLTEPGLAAWLERALEHHPAASKAMSGKGTRTLKVTLLVRGSALDKAAVEEAFAAPLRALGFTLRFVPAKEAELVLKLSAASDKTPVPGNTAVRLGLGLESVREGKTVWQSELYRVESDKTAQGAVANALTWVSRIGGRDLFFRWLGEHGMPGLLGNGPLAGDPHGHGHGHGAPGLPPELRGGRTSVPGPGAPPGPRPPRPGAAPHGH